MKVHKRIHQRGSTKGYINEGLPKVTSDNHHNEAHSLTIPVLHIVFWCDHNSKLQFGRAVHTFKWLEIKYLRTTIFLHVVPSDNVFPVLCSVCGRSDAGLPIIGQIRSQLQRGPRRGAQTMYYLHCTALLGSDVLLLLQLQRGVPRTMYYVHCTTWRGPPNYYLQCTALLGTTLLLLFYFIHPRTGHTWHRSTHFPIIHF